MQKVEYEISTHYEEGLTIIKTANASLLEELFGLIVGELKSYRVVVKFDPDDEHHRSAFLDVFDEPCRTIASRILDGKISRPGNHATGFEMVDKEFGIDFIYSDVTGLIYTAEPYHVISNEKEALYIKSLYMYYHNIKLTDSTKLNKNRVIELYKSLEN